MTQIDNRIEYKKPAYINPVHTRSVTLSMYVSIPGEVGFGGLLMGEGL